MVVHKNLIRISVLAVLFTAPYLCLAGDLDDGISSYTDDRISDADQLGSPDVNFSYLEVRAKARAGMLTSSAMHSKVDGWTSGELESSLDGSGSGNINSVVLYPGANVYGDIVIVDTSTGDTTQIVLGDQYTSSVGSDLDVESSIQQIGSLDD